ncbi:MAG: hypothetical protein JSW46_15455 [Gemmatimonadota bacterium]|nr:MAG: hypothetical protein JSW46_15455 [Gemmatimonadota bacterium]
MTHTAPSPESRVRALWRRVALQLAQAAVGGALTAAGGLLLFSWLAGASPLWQRPSVLPLVLSTSAVAVAAAWVWRLAVRASRWNREAAAAEIEERVGLPRGSVRGALEPGLERPGTSRSLVELHRSRLAKALEGFGPAELGSAVARAARAHAAVAATLALVALVASLAIWLSAREQAVTAWAAVLHPVRHLSAPPFPPVRLDADREIRRGRDLRVRVEAPLRDSVQLAWRPRGAVAQRRWLGISEGRAEAVVPRVEAPLAIWAMAPDGALSDTLRVATIDPLLLIDLRIDLHFPPHTRRETEVFSDLPAVITVPDGTRATVGGVVTRPVERAALTSSRGRTIPFVVSDARRFRSSFAVTSGTWGWDIVGSQGEALEGNPDSLRFLAVADSAPRVRITYPGVDTLLSIDMTQPLLVEVGDDYGLALVELVSWRVSAWGERWPEQVEALPIGSDMPRANLAALIDARGRGFLPGDTLRYFVRAYDNAPDPQIGMSREYVLRLPSLDEVRERAISDARDLVEDAESLAERAREHQESIEALERSTEIQPPPGTNLAPERAESGVEFRETEEARRALEEAESLLETSRKISQSLRELQESIERAGLNDESVLERLAEIESLFERLLTPELQERFEELREALVQLDPDQIREAIRQLSEGSVDFRARVERAVELLRRAALEQQFLTLETQAEELVEAQEELADAVSDAAAAAGGREVADSLAGPLSRQAAELGARAGELARAVNELAEELATMLEERAAERASAAQSAASEAAGSDEQVAGRLPSRPREARGASLRALAQMQRAASGLREGRQEMQEAWRQDVVAAMGRAQAEALELARRQRELNERLSSAAERGDSDAMSDQVAMRSAVQQVENQLTDAAESSLLVDPRLAQAAAEIGAAMEELVGQMADASRAGPPDWRLGDGASEGLAELAYRLMQAGDAAAMAQSGTGLQEALARLGQLAEQQGALNQELGGITPGSLGDALLRELQRLANQQRAIAQDLGAINQSLGPRGQVLGQLDALEREAEDLAQQLEQGRLDEEILERQNRLFQRLLDAGRTLERDEFERERRAERPTDVEVLRPGELPPGLLRGRAYPHPASDVLSRYPPAIRRLILEYFDRLNAREGTGGS